MGAYNRLLAEMECPRCGSVDICEVEFRLGRLDFREYHLGEVLTWAGGHRHKPLRRPDGGTTRGEGYAECPSCERDFWVTVEVRDDVLTTVIADPDRPGYIP